MTRAFAAACVVLALVGCDEQQAAAAAGEGAAAATPAISECDTAELVTLLQERRGTPMLVNFWATWCEPCVAELPDLQAAAEPFRAAGGQVLAVAAELMGPFDMDEARARVSAFAGRTGYDFEFVLFTGDRLLPLLEQLALPELPDADAVPVTIAFNARGEAVGLHTGRADREEFSLLGRRALGN